MTVPDHPAGLDDAAFRRGFGTYEVGIDRMGDETYTQVLETVLDVGYRHLDSAQDYGTESHVAEAIDRSELTRDDVFIATKLHWQNLGYEDAIETAQESRNRLAVDSIDLLYVHVPAVTYDPDETLPALDALVDDGVVDRIGLSNFTPELLEVAIERLDTPVFAHQVEMHPLLQQERLHEFAVNHGHWLVAFSPLIQGMAREIGELKRIATKHDATPFEVSLAWLHSKGNVVTLSHSTTPAHIRENFAAPDLELDDADIELIESIDREFRVNDGRIDPWNQRREER